MRYSFSLNPEGRLACAVCGDRRCGLYLYATEQGNPGPAICEACLPEVVGQLLARLPVAEWQRTGQIPARLRR